MSHVLGRLGRKPWTHRLEAHLFRPRILLAVAAPSVRRFLAGVLVDDGSEVIQIASGDALYDQLDPAAGSLEPALVIADVRLRGLSGLEILCAIRSWGWTVPVILMTHNRDEEMSRLVRLAGRAYLFGAPLDIDDLRTAVVHCLARR